MENTRVFIPYTVLIGVQARTTSKRFPEKVFALLGGKPVLNHMIKTCETTVTYMNRYANKTGITVKFALLVPKGDEIVKRYSHRTTILEGSEEDVLSRYYSAAQSEQADFIVRLTADCPLIPSYVISKHIKTATKNLYDYVSNVDEDLRTAADGFDCEVMSYGLLEWLNKNAQDKDREHVTTLSHRDPPHWARIGHIIGFHDLSGMKLSVDTPEDLERVNMEYEKIEQALRQAELKHGKDSIHRL